MREANRFSGSSVPRRNFLTLSMYSEDVYSRRDKITLNCTRFVRLRIDDLSFVMLRPFSDYSKLNKRSSFSSL